MTDQPFLKKRPAMASGGPAQRSQNSFDGSSGARNSQTFADNSAPLRSEEPKIEIILLAAAAKAVWRFEHKITFTVTVVEEI